MKQSDAVQFLYRDIKIVTSHLTLKDYDQVFEEEMQEYFPFSEPVMDWLIKLYTGEKYSAFDEDKLSLYYEKEHPFLFIRDLAHMNCWRMGMHSPERRDHITGLMFSETTQYALEATFSLCRPSLIHGESSQWFDFKQAMNNLEKIESTNFDHQAYKGLSMFYLYFHLSGDSNQIDQAELRDLIEPYRAAIDIAFIEGNEELRTECGQILRMVDPSNAQTLLDGVNA